MTAVLCALLSGAMFFFSIQIGAVWWLAWFAPVPLLWFAFKGGAWWKVVAVCWAAYAVGMCNMIGPYWGRLPDAVLYTSILLPGLPLAAIVLAARFVANRISPLAGVAAFAAILTGFFYLLSFGANGTAPDWAYSQVGAPVLIQSASVFGIWIVTFLLTFVSAGIAMTAARGDRWPAIAAVILFAANAAFGFARIETAPQTQSVRIGLAGNDQLNYIRPEKDATDKVVATYIAAAHKLAAGGASLIVFPEKDAMLLPAWRDDTVNRLRDTARQTHTTIVMGFDDHGPKRLNDALIFTPDGAPPQQYAKRHMVPGLENMFVPGPGGFMMADRTGVAICKDMDFQTTLRGDARDGRTLMAVPAWDFEGDRWWHARLAIMRGVENGFALARAAKNGLLTLSDQYGRVLAIKPTRSSGMVTLVGDLPRGTAATVYTRIGDVFAWFAIALGAGLLFGALLFRSRER